jgi:hypothetical protein
MTRAEWATGLAARMQTVSRNASPLSDVMNPEKKTVKNMNNISTTITTAIANAIVVFGIV